MVRQRKTRTCQEAGAGSGVGLGRAEIEVQRDLACCAGSIRAAGWSAVPPRRRGSTEAPRVRFARGWRWSRGQLQRRPRVGRLWFGALRWWSSRVLLLIVLVSSVLGFRRLRRCRVMPEGWRAVLSSIDFLLNPNLFPSCSRPLQYRREDQNGYRSDAATAASGSEMNGAQWT